ncbi:MAG: dethiobiotin synthase [Chitinophagales bacterium]
MKGFFVTGIGTDIGKTVIAAILVEALKADYWKPVQTGSRDFTDADFIREYTLHHQTIHPEEYLFKEPVSPHLAAALEDKNIDIQNITLPKSSNSLIVEGAGGVLVPLNEKYLIKDLIIKFQLPVILVSMNYLGSINHTLLSINALTQAGVNIAGIIFNGVANPDSERYILNYSGLKLLGKIPKADIMSKGFIVQQAEAIRGKLLEVLATYPDQTHDDTQLQVDYESF